MTEWWGSKEWANHELRYAISILQLKAFKSRKISDYLAVALDIKTYLMDHGFWWQAKILDYHIHLFQAKNRDALHELKTECLHR